MSRSATEGSLVAQRNSSALAARGWLAPWRRRQPTAAVYLKAEGLWSCTAADQAPQHAADWPSWCAQHEGVAVDVLLAGGLTHQVVVDDPALPLASTQAVQDYARHQFTHFHGPAAQQWPLATWADGSLVVASAVHGTDVAALHTTAQRHAVVLRSMRPWWAVAWQQAVHTPAQSLLWPAQARQALVLVDGTHATWVWAQQQRVAGVLQRRLHAASVPALLALLHGLQQQHQVPPSATLLLACGVAGEAAQLTAACTLLSSPIHTHHPAPGWLHGNGAPS